MKDEKNKGTCPPLSRGKDKKYFLVSSPYHAREGCFILHTSPFSLQLT
jgi:hypothetical protein